MKREQFYFASIGGTKYRLIVEYDGAGIVTTGLSRVPEHSKDIRCNTDAEEVQRRVAASAGHIAADMAVAAMRSISGSGEDSWIGRTVNVSRQEFTGNERHRTGVLCVVANEGDGKVKVVVVDGLRLNGTTRWIHKSRCSLLAKESATASGVVK